MRACAVADATDEEILKVCNTENPQLVTRGWHTVVRKKKDLDGVDKAALPGDCVECKGRKHFIVLCM